MATEDFRYVVGNVSAPSNLPPLRLGSSTLNSWISTVSAPVDFPLSAFFSAMEHAVRHPEYSSSSILRADILVEIDFSETDSNETTIAGEGEEYVAGILADLGEDWHCIKRMRRRLVPKSPLLDAALLQECLLLENEVGTGGMLLYLPESGGLDEEGRLPHYHPQTYALAIRYCTAPPTLDEVELESAMSTTTIQIDLIPLPPSTTKIEPPSEIPGVEQRLYRTTLMLLKSAWKVSRGRATGYEKRVNHDLLAGKEEVQDLYRAMKLRYRAVIDEISPRITFSWLLDNWHEDTDPKKHVYEDVAIAAWLILVWRGLYGEGNGAPGGFVDVGCGNGLLVYILSQEGYSGYGVDLRRRKSWPSYPGTTDLREQSLNPTALLSSSTPPFPESSFLIGNHADELTPWIPLLAAATPGSAFLNIPCCLHCLSGRFTFSNYTIPLPFLAQLPSLSLNTPEAPSYSAKKALAASLAPVPLMIPFYAPKPGEDQQGGRYQAFQLYLAHLTLQCGFVPEREALRIPSTKNFGFLGRLRTWDGMSEEEQAVQKEVVRCTVVRLVDEVGDWTARIREGKLPLQGH